MTHMEEFKTTGGRMLFPPGFISAKRIITSMNNAEFTYEVEYP